MLLHAPVDASSDPSQQSHTPSPTTEECNHLLSEPRFLQKNCVSGQAEVPATRTHHQHLARSSNHNPTPEPLTWLVAALRAVAVVIVHLACVPWGLHGIPLSRCRRTFDAGMETPDAPHSNVLPENLDASAWWAPHEV